MKITDHSPEKKIAHYEWSFKAHLGTGSYGKVYLGRDTRDNSLVAMKIVGVSKLNSCLLKYLKSEIEVMKNIRGDNIVNLLDVFWTPNNVYIIQEYCDGGDLRQYMQKLGTELSENNARNILRQIIQGFKVLVDSNLIHRDLKPENILLKGNKFKIADFGFARSVESSDKTLLNSVVGTPLYMSPQILKSEPYTVKSDIWSIGLMFYEMCFGKLPYLARTQYELIQKITNCPLQFHYSINISEEAKQFIKECLQPQEINRLDCQQVINHPILQNVQFKQQVNKSKEDFINSMDNKAKLLIQKIQMVIQKKNVDIKTLFNALDQENKGELNISNFERLIKMIDETKMTSEIEIKYLFDKIDVNGDKSISFDEFKYYIMELDYATYQINKDPFLEEKATNVLKILKNKIEGDKINIQKLVSQFDQKNKGGLTQQEFQSLVGMIDNQISEKEMEYMFMKIDSDQSGLLETIEIEEAINEAECSNTQSINQQSKESIDDKTKQMVEYLKEIIQSNGLDLKRIFRRFDKHKRKALDLQEFSQIMQIIDETINEQEVIHVFKKVDYNDDKLISYEEFYNFMK